MGNVTTHFQGCVLKGTHITITGVFTAGISLRRASVSFVLIGHSYPYPELLYALYVRGHNTCDTGTSFVIPAWNFRELFTPVPRYPELV